ncbi:hypothetical protein [Nannocystis sp.]|uniref:hypothetical protein n=1 Tax=Nannocystis sp. TaxID=1962667 RepID=UPI0025F04596|nr:hypothetical protein [Nannocystis sp.]MBK7825063.1 hypothetical protein [Nannocystis sp.]
MSTIAASERRQKPATRTGTSDWPQAGQRGCAWATTLASSGASQAGQGPGTPFLEPKIMGLAQYHGDPRRTLAAIDADATERGVSEVMART